MAKKIVKYQCSETKKLFKTPQEALDSESKAKEKKNKKRTEEIFREYFPIRWKDDDRYKRH